VTPVTGESVIARKLSTIRKLQPGRFGDAPDAKDAREQLIIWEDKAKH
jgi:hypothetical protein